MFGQLRVADENGKVYFNLSDACKALSIGNARNVKSRLEERGVHSIDTPTFNQHGTEVMQKMVYIDEPNLYRCIFQSRKAEAQKFQEWVFEEVLPQIRRTGGYIPTHDQCGRTMTDDEVLARAQEIVSSTLAQKDSLISYQQAQLEAQRPMVVFYDAVAATNTTCSVAELAKMLKANGVDVGQNRLFEWLRNNGYLCTKGGAFYNTPYQHWVEAGLFRTQTQHYEKPDGECVVCYTTRVTGKGVQYFVDGFKSGRFIY